MIAKASKCDLVLFDFDGTLVDTAPDLVRATNLFLESQGFEALSEEFIRSKIGMGLRKLITDLYPENEMDDHRRRKLEGEFLACYEREFLSTPRVFDGVEEFLYGWQGHFAIVSNKRERFIRPILAKVGLDKFPWLAVVGGDSYPHMKPHPVPFLSVMERVSATPEATAMVGDGIPDVEGALAVGLSCVAVDFGYTPIEQLMTLGAHAQISSYSELESTLNQLY